MTGPRFLVPAACAAVALLLAATGSVAVGALAGLLGVAWMLRARSRATVDGPTDPGRRRALAVIGGASAAGVLVASGAGSTLRRALRPDPAPALDRALRGLGADNVDLVRRQFMPGRSGDLQLVLAPWNSSNYPQESVALVPDDPRTSHASVWLYLQRIPIVVHAPGLVPPGDNADRVTLADLAPTTAHLMGFDGFEAADGRVLPGIPRPTTPPKIVVTFVIDGGGWNVLTHWPDAWPNLRRLMAEGMTYRDAIVGSFPAVTACAHATIGTGAFPRTHGVTGHNVRWRGRPRKAYGTPGDADPSLIEVPTLADRWTEATDARAWIGEIGYQVWHLGMIGRGGTAPQGRPPVGVLWDELGGGGWIAQHPDRYRLPDAVPTPASFEALRAAYDDPGIDARFDPSGAKAVCCTPPIVEHEGDLVAMTLEAEPVGRGEVTDLLYVNVKAPDYAGHVYNFTSERERIALEATDRQIGRIADLLTERFAPGEAVLIVTADHGQAPTVNLAGGVRLDPIQLERFLRRRFGPSVLPVVETVAPSEVYLSGAGLAEMGVTDADVAASLLDYTYGENLGDYVPVDAVDRAHLDARLFAAVLPASRLASLVGADLGSLGTGAFDADPTGIPAVTW